MAEKLNRGDKVKVRLSKKHELEGDLVEHAAKFVRYLPDEWAEVELEQHHSMDAGRKVHSLSVPVAQLVAALLLLFLFVAPAIFTSSLSARAQATPVTLASVDATLANATTCTGGAQTFSTTSSALNSAGFRNLGQTQHSITSTATGATIFQAEIDGVDGQGNVVRISDIQKTPGTNSALSGNGRYTNIQVKVICSPGTATFTLNYSGTFTAASPPTGAYLVGMVDKIEFSGQAANAGASDIFWQPPYANSFGTILFKYAGGSLAGSSVVVQCVASTLSGGNIFQQVFSLVNVASNQSFPVAAASCPFISVTYTSGGATAATFSLEYLFQIPGTQSGMASSYAFHAAGGTAAPGNLSFASLVEKGGRWSVTSSPAAGSQASASQAVGAQGVFHVADCVSYSAGAIAAPAATQLTINLRDGASGAGTVLWSKTVAVPATAGVHITGDFCGLNLINVSNSTAMTLEFSAALASEFESVTLTGYDVQ
jgi:hypothetical protein